MTKISNTTIIVYHNGSGMLVDSDVAESLNLKNNDIIKTEDEFWKILGRNAGAMIAVCRAKLLMEV